MKVMLIRPGQLQFFKDGIKITARRIQNIIKYQSKLRKFTDVEY